MDDFKFLMKNIDKLLAGLAQEEKGLPQQSPSLTLAPVSESTFLHTPD